MKISRWMRLWAAVVVVTCCGGAAAQNMVSGAEFAGGAKDHVGSSFFAEQVNMVYARPTGSRASMRAVLKLEKLPDAPLFLHVKGRDDDAPGSCKISVALNGKTLFEGANTFKADGWKTEKLAIPAGTAKAGDNEVVIANLEAKGEIGMPPWFMVASCGLGGEKLVLVRDIRKDLVVRLPGEVRPFPEPLPEGAQPGFQIRGTKGWNWTPEQYLAEIPVLARFKMNFLMNCYLSMFAREPKFENRWWEPLSDAHKQAYAKVVRACQENGIEFCFAIHPQLSSPRPMDPTSDEDFEKLWPNFAWAQSVGVKWFSLPIDDVHVMQGVRIAGPEHARLVNKLLARLRQHDAAAQLVFCPTWYWGDGTEEKQRAYLEALAKELHPDVYLFWTGDGVTGSITLEAARTFRKISGHRIILWDNYPVNDAQPAMHLGPVIGRDPALGDVIDGYMSNPHCAQNEINRIPLLTCADYAWNPGGYDPARSIGQAIVHLEQTAEARRLLADLVEAYPGMLLYGNGHTGFNSVRDQYGRIAAQPHARFAAGAYIAGLESLAARMRQVFPDRYLAARKTLDDDVAWAKAAFAGKYQ